MSKAKEVFNKYAYNMDDFEIDVIDFFRGVKNKLPTQGDYEEALEEKAKSRTEVSVPKTSLQGAIGGGGLGGILGSIGATNVKLGRKALIKAIAKGLATGATIGAAAGGTIGAAVGKAAKSQGKRDLSLLAKKKSGSSAADRKLKKEYLDRVKFTAEGEPYQRQSDYDYNAYNTPVVGYI